MLHSQGCKTQDISEAEYMAIPWYGAPDVLTDFYDSFENAFSSSNNTNSRTVIIDGEETPWHRIPVKFNTVIYYTVITN
jgi:hypothetical protein